METQHKVDDLLKRSLQFETKEIPEPADWIKKRLRSKFKRKNTLLDKRCISSLIRFFNLDIKLYHAVIALTAVVILFIILRNSTGDIKKSKTDIIVVDTSAGSGLKDDTFKIRNYGFRIN